MKKNIQRLLSVVLSLILIFSNINMLVFAADFGKFKAEGCTVELDGTNPGTATVALVATSNESIFGIEGYWDLTETEGSNELKLNGLASEVITFAGGLNSYADVPTGHVQWLDTSFSNPAKVSNGTKLLTATYTIPADTPAGDYTVRFQCTVLTDSTYNPDTTETYFTAKITVKGPAAHVCSGTKVTGQAATCTVDGWNDYYKCTDDTCGKLYSDEGLTQLITDLEEWKNGKGKIAAGHDYKFVEEVPAKHTAEELKEGMNAHFFCSACNTYFDSSKVATTKEALTVKASHSYTIENGYKEADGHADTCSCGAHDTVKVHTPNVENTSEADQVCSVCGYVIAEHKCNANLTKVDATSAGCTTDGNKEYYKCACGKYYKDDSAAVEIPDLDSWKANDGKIPAGHTYGELIEEQGVVHTTSELKDGMKAHYFCSACNTYFDSSKVATTKEALTIKAEHSHNQKISDAAHLVAGTGTDCQDAKEYYYDCSYEDCENIGTASWVSSEKGAHKLATTYTQENNQHFHKCTVDGCTYTDTKTDCSGGTATCQTKAVCSTCGNSYGTVAGHDFGDDWEYKEADGHAHVCQTSGCTEHDTVIGHTPDISAPTETQDQKCEVCGYVIAAATGHIHQNHLTKVKAEEAKCTENGNIEYYTCSCGKWFSDATATVEIINKDSVVIDKLGHDYTEQIKDTAHMKSEATKCTEKDTYWYDCSRCDSNAKNDLEAADKFWTSTDAGDHNFDEKIEDAAHFVNGTGADCQDAKEYYFDCAYCDEMGTTSWASDSYGDHKLASTYTQENDQHFHECTVDGCTYTDTKTDCSGGTATCQAKAVCSTCGNSYGKLGDHNFSEKLTDAAHLVSGSGANCQDKKEYYYDCILCDTKGTTTWESDSYGEHSYTQQIADADHLVAGTGMDCQDAKEYYYDCAYCDSKGTTSWVSSEKGAHKLATTYTQENNQHFHKCTVDGCTYTDTKTDCSGGTATCQTKAVCSTCGNSYGTVAGHDFGDDWEYKVAEGHAHVCQTSGCTEHDTVIGHTPDISAPTETQDQKCEVCGYVIAAATGHIHQNHLTKVKAEEAKCTETGNIEYYTCSCGKWFSDATGNVEITDKDSVVIDKLGHAYTEQIKDTAHLKSEATKCTEYDIYWYDCSRCDSNAKNDSEAADKFWTSTDAGDHNFNEKIEDADHFVNGTGTDCQHAKEYYFDCEYCAEMGTTSWASDSYGDHKLASTYTQENDQHFHKCTVTGCDHTDTKEDCAGGTATCQAKAVCSTCEKNYGELGSHNFSEKLADAAHLVSGSGANCQDKKEYYYDCTLCDTKGTTTWESDSYGEHVYGDMIKAQDAVHTPTELKASVAAHYFCDECDTYFTEEKEETTYDALEGETPVHSYGDWVNTDPEDHWKECSCGLKANEGAHAYDNIFDTNCNDCGHEREVENPAVTLNLETLSLEVGEVQTLTVEVTPKEGFDYNLGWSSDDENVATVDQNGKITAVSAGTAEITVTLLMGAARTTISDVCVVTVTEHDTKLDIQEGGITNVPDSLKEIGLDTPEKIKASMVQNLENKNSQIDEENVVHYDVTFMYTEDGGETWQPADETHWPEDGRMVVELPYPEGTDSTYTFVVAHMFTSGAFGKTPGEIEYPEVTNTENGIRFEVTGLSPIAVGFVGEEEPEVPTTSVTVTKVWEDDDNVNRPASVTVVLMADDEEYGERVELNKENNWTCTWTELPAGNANAAAAIRYTVDEVEVPEGYEKTINEVEVPAGVGYEIINTLIEEEPEVPETTSVTVVKEWDVPEGIDTPENVEVYLLANGNEVTDSRTFLDAGNEWTYTWNELPVATEDGTPIVYTVDEVDVEDFEKSIGDAQETDTGIAITITITNTYVEPENPVYDIVVINGKSYTGAGVETLAAEEGTKITIKADEAPEGKEFDKWVVDSGDITLADATKAETTFDMPAEDVQVTATYKDKVVTPPADDNNKEDTSKPSEDNKAEESKPAETSKPATNTETPKTGDTSNIFLWLAVLLVSGCSVVGLILFGKKRRVL